MERTLLNKLRLALCFYISVMDTVFGKNIFVPEAMRGANHTNHIVKYNDNPMGRCVGFVCLFSYMHC